jgi:predicted MPP superfamily phosphohydrolase
LAISNTRWHPLASADKRGVAAAGIAGALALSSAYWARFHAPFEPVLDRVAIDVGRRMAGLPPLRVGFASDTHIGPVIRATDVERAMRLLARAEPDLLLLGGDYICESPRYESEAAEVLGVFASLPRLGTFAVLGNHDYSNDAERLCLSFSRHGIRVLRNECTTICDGSSTLAIVGIDDAILGRPDLNRAFANAPDRALTIALWHEPDWASLTADRGVVVQLSGHSHGGQIRLPGVGHIAAPAGGQKFVSGLNTADGIAVYTSRGVGVYRPPIRVRCRPEVTLLTFC